MQFVARGLMTWAWFMLTIVAATPIVLADGEKSPPPGEPVPAVSEPEDQEAETEPTDEESTDEEPPAAEPTPAAPADDDRVESPPPRRDDDDPPPQPTADDGAPARPSESTSSAATSVEEATDEPAEPTVAEPTVAEPTPAEPPAEPTEAEPNPSSSDASEAGAMEPAMLKGVRPGKTTREELHAAWGQPHEVTRLETGERETFSLAPYDKVQVTIIHDVVDSLAVHLEKPVALDAIAAELGVGDFEPVNVLDDLGHLAGQAYPERGVLVGYAPKSSAPRVSHFVIQPLDAQPFLDRAWKRLDTSFVGCLADVRQALELAPDAIEPRLVHIELTLRAGDLEQALESAREMVKRAPNELEHRLRLARILGARGDHTQALKLSEAVSQAKGASRLVMARARLQMGGALAAGEKRDHAGAIKHHLKAIELAEPLAGSKTYAERRAAKEILLEAHLGVAHDIGWGRWQQKQKVVPQWIARAATLADDLVAAEHASLGQKLRLHAGALAALSGIDHPPDAARWIDGASKLGGQLHESAADPLVKAHVAWRLGVALADAVEIEAARQKLDHALELGAAAFAQLEQGEAAGKQLPARDFVRGRLCYRVGAMLAIDKSDHEGAITWFDRAVPLLERPVPPAVVDAAKQGETFVSMAISYWETNQRAEALRLTRQGVSLMEQATDQGTLERAALAVPYGNLATMHEAQGDAEEAQRYAALASRHEGAVRK